MTEIQYKNGGGKLIWTADDFAEGLGPQGRFASAQNLKLMQPSGWAYLSNIDPNISYGTLRPGYGAGSTYTNSGSLTGQLVSAQYVNNTYIYGVDTGGTVQFVDTITKSVYTTSPFPHTITGTTPVGQDGIIYRHKLSGTYVNSYFYSYYNNTNWNVGAFENFASNGLNGTFADTFMSAIPATPLDVSTASPADGKDVDQKTAPHPLCIGADGILYIGSGRYLHAYDGNSSASSGTFSSRVLTLPQGFQIVAIRKYQDQLLIAGNYYSNVASGLDGTGEALLYTWNYVDLDITQVIPLEDPYVTALFLWKGTPTVITSGKPERNGTNKIKVISGNTVAKVADFDGTLPIQRGIIVSNDMLYINAGGKIVTYGSNFKQSTAINQIGSTSTTGNTGILVYNSNTDALVASSSSGSTYCINNINSGNAIAVAYAYYYEPEFSYGKVGKVTSVEIQFASTVASNVSNGDLSCVLLTDYGQGSMNITTNLSTIAAPITKKYILSATGGTLPIFSSIAPEFVFSAGTANVPVISKFTIEYEETVMPSNT